MVRVAVTGARGFVGKHLVHALIARGYGVIAVGRDGHGPDMPDVEYRRFDATSNVGSGALAGASAVIHLAGESVGGRWTPEKKKAIYDSRIEGTRALVGALASCEPRPAVLVSASASGYYGNRGDEPLFEDSAPGHDFLARVCSDWEREAAGARAYGLRVASVRTGIVLGPGGGALAQMAPPFRFGVGGPFGGGTQFVPWIHLDDLVALYIMALERDEICGPVNAVAPDYATNARFAQALGNALGRPALVPAPGFALRAFLGEFADTLLGGQLIVPAIAQDAGFAWRHPNLEAALIDALPRDSVRKPGIRRFASSDYVNAPLEDVFRFFSHAKNLGRITPPAMQFDVLSDAVTMQRGALVDYRLRVRGIPMHWRTLIAEWNPPDGFVDVQLHGPYALWRHEHRFERSGGGTNIRDEVAYALPFVPLSNVLAPIVESDVRQIFEFRRSVIQQLFSAGNMQKGA